MAEKYGTIPKRFTKKWWEYFWQYYKIHTIAVGLVIILTVMTVIEISTSTKYDFNITYTGNLMFPDSEAEIFKNRLEEYIEDTDGNGEKNINFQQLVFFFDNFQDAQYMAAMSTKLQLEFTTEDTMIFIFDESKSDFLFDESLEGAFMDINEWADDNVPADLIFYSNNIPYAVNLSQSSILKDFSIPCDSLYVAVRASVGENSSEVISQAKRVANALIK